MIIKDTAEIISLVLTVPTLAFAIWVVCIYGPKIGIAQDVWQGLKTGKGLNEKQLLLGGICIGFIGAFIDNLYWGIAWGSEFLNLELASFWFSNGVYPNIFFRQGCGILAATMHLYAAIKMSKKNQVLYSIIWASALFVGWGLIIFR